MNSTNINLDKQASRFFILIVLSIILFFGDKSGLISPLRGFLEQAVFPVKVIFSSWSVGGTRAFGLVSNYETQSNLQSKIINLSKINDELKIANQNIKNENANLRKQLESPLPPSWKFTPTQVLGLSRYMQIWGGENEGLKEGMPVVEGMSLVGRVINLTSFSSAVILPSDPDSVISAKTNRGTRGKVVGQFGEKVVFSNVLQKDQLFLGDTVISAGDDGYPPGLVIGKVVNIEAKDFEAYKNAELTPEIDYKSITNVFVITGM